MKRVRVIPLLLIQKGGLVKSVKFRKHQYIGDPINAVKIFNEKEVDELVILDISSRSEKKPPDLDLVKKIAGEAFMPLAWGGAITQLKQIRELISAGVEKCILNTAAFENPALIAEAAAWAGSQSIVASIDIRKNMFGQYRVWIRNGSENTGTDPVVFARQMESAGAGEILLQDITNEGSFSGYNTDIIRKVCSAVNIPVVASGGAGSITDFRKALEAGASAVAAGSFFVLQRPHKAVLISYPSQEQLNRDLFSKL
jgi:cyclase